MALVDIAPMSFFLFLFLILSSGFGSKRKKQKSKRTLRCICVVLGVGSNLEYHITFEGWNSFLLLRKYQKYQLSCLSVFTTRVDAHSEQSLKELQDVLRNMTPLFNVSTAALYAPLPIVNECTRKMMYCYLLELNVILHEEEYNNKEDKEDDLSIIHSLKNNYNSSNNCSMCSACEAHPLTNSTTFSARMQDFVMQLLSVLGDKKYQDCD